MKNLFLIFAVAILSTLSLNAQEVKFGAKAGVNFSSINGDMADSFDGRTALHFGGVAEISVSEKFAIQPEILYSAQGADYEEEDFTGTVKVDYLNVPVLAKFFVAEGFSVEAGPQIGFLLSAKDEYDFDGGSGEDDIKDQAKGVEVAAALGLGYQLESGLNFGARYNIGLTEINDFDDMDSEFDTSDISWKNGVFQIFVGWFF